MLTSLNVIYFISGADNKAMEKPGVISGADETKEEGKKDDMGNVETTKKPFIEGEMIQL